MLKSHASVVEKYCELCCIISNNVKQLRYIRHCSKAIAQWLRGDYNRIGDNLRRQL